MRKRTETNPESKNKSVICVRSLQPLNHSLGIQVFFSNFQVLLLLANTTSDVVTAGSHQESVCEASYLQWGQYSPMEGQRSVFYFF